MDFWDLRDRGLSDRVPTEKWLTQRDMICHSSGKEGKFGNGGCQLHARVRGRQARYRQAGIKA